MHYELEELHFSFDLPDGWKEDPKSLMKIRFCNPDAPENKLEGVITLEVSTILPQYREITNREQFLAEPGAQVFRTKVGDESNAVVLQKAEDSEISVVRDDIQYIIGYFNDAPTKEAIKCLKRSARFPSPSEARAYIVAISDPRRRMFTNVLLANSAEEKQRILSEAGVAPIIRRRGYTMYGLGDDSDPAQQKLSTKRWWQFWK